ncbi:hypothetical protein K7X08_023845 [Anisodus acutangulus]|uniref:Protein kinase domain-containing protein n=1 Tax=Anisodus acutangulus TaxID=402998 RepID=A0A9Q1M8W3_9SOLA|nr:hypothetical protein K7X08_023845 [Anisodus acutangulus]
MVREVCSAYASNCGLLLWAGKGRRMTEVDDAGREAPITFACSSSSSSRYLCHLIIFLLLVSVSAQPGDVVDDADDLSTDHLPDAKSSSEALFNFKSSLSTSSPKGQQVLGSWAPSTSPCTGNNANWLGVICFEGDVWGLQLENLDLSGAIDIDSLLPLHFLRTLSFMNNNFKGAMPDWNKLGALKSLYLSNNSFSGQIPDDAFKGNKGMCGKPLKSTCSSPSPEANTTNSLNSTVNGQSGDIIKKSPSVLSRVMLIVAVCLVVLCLAIVLILIIRQRSRNSSQDNPQLTSRAVESNNIDADQNTLSSAPDVIMSGNPTYPRHDNNNSNNIKAAEAPTAATTVVGKLSFVRDDRPRFDLQDLLRASAEVLGSGNLGSSFKAQLVDGQAVVVKRFKQMNHVAKEDFHEHMRRLGRLSHSNLLPLVAYYYRKEEKLLVYDYAFNGSLASHLHGNHSRLDWSSRLKIIKGVAKALAYLHNELPSLALPHGHLKSSNVLLDKYYNPLLMDYTLVPLVNLSQVQHLLVAYKAPEYAQLGRITRKTDVWSLGILILETLTGKLPTNYLALSTGYGTELASWVDTIIKDNELAFDKEMDVTTKDSQGQIQKLFNIGVACCQEDLDTRWDIKEALESIQALNDKDDADDQIVGV